MSTMPQTPPQDQQTEATIQRIDFNQSTGWYTIHTDQGEFSTKFPEPAQEAQQAVGQRVSLVFQVSEPRQGRNGTWYQSRYLRRIVASYASPAQPQPSAPPQPQGFAPQPQVVAQPQVSSDDRELRIMRQTAGKLAVQTMALVPSEHRGFGNQVMVAEAWLRYFMHGPQAVDAPTTVAEPDQLPTGPSDDIPW